MNLTSEARGFFEIFVPGAFLMLNLLVGKYLMLDDKGKEVLARIAGNQTLALIAAISFGYLLGVLLRLCRTELPDRLSAWFLRKFDPRSRDNGRDSRGWWLRALLPERLGAKRYAAGFYWEYKAWANKPFPYVRWIRSLTSRSLPDEVERFCATHWDPPEGKVHDREFLNFFKVLVSAIDPEANRQINAAEALSRYVAGMFYALLSALAFMCVTVVRSQLAGQFVLLLMLIYAVALVGILANFRFIRTKEVETVFATLFGNWGKLELVLSRWRSDPIPPSLE